MIRALPHTRRQISLSGNARKRVSRSEALMKEVLEALGVSGFLQQQPMGRYSVDFILPEQAMAIEVSGRYWHSSQAQQKRDSKKVIEVEKEGLRLFVAWDDEIHLWALQLSKMLPMDKS